MIYQPTNQGMRSVAHASCKALRVGIHNVGASAAALLFLTGVGELQQSCL